MRLPARSIKLCRGKFDCITRMRFPRRQWYVMPELILASESPRRRELLATAGFRFTIRARPGEEVRARGEGPLDYARRLAHAKAEAAGRESGEVVLGADTVVVLGENVLEKPRDAADARAMLNQLSGCTHSVITGICLWHQNGTIIDTETTLVHFAKL